MKLTPYYLLFSLAFLGLMGQKAYEYKLDQDDRKEVFCKNALFLLQAPDSLSNRVVDFDLPYDSLVKKLKNNVFLDSCNSKYFEFSSKIKFPKKNKSNEIFTNFPLRIEYTSKCYSSSIVCDIFMNFWIVYNGNLVKFSRMVTEDYIETLDSLPKLLKKRIDTLGPITIVFNEISNQAFLEKVITIVSKMNIENYKNAALRNYSKQLCDLNKDELNDLKTRIGSPKIEIKLKLSFPPPPPPNKKSPSASHKRGF